MLSKVRKFLSEQKDTCQRNIIKRRILRYWNAQPSNSQEKYEAELNYLRNNPLTVFPYPFFNPYMSGEVKLYTDKQRDMKYVMHEGKRLYFKRAWTDQRILDAYKFLCAEQDHLSPHRYLTEEFTVNSNDIVFDIGSAEGNFALSIVDQVQKLVLFEADPSWIEPLKATFEPWKEKVEIIQAFVGRQTSGEFVSIDEFISVKNICPTFIKLDVDGAEEEVVSGAINTLTSVAPLKVAFCTYHQSGDADRYDEFLSQKAFNCSFSEGYILFYFWKPFNPPYFRRGLIRAWR